MHNPRIVSSKPLVKVIISDVDSRKGFDVVNVIRRLYGFDCILCAGRDYKYQLPFIYSQKVYPLRGSSYDTFEEDFTKLLKLFSADRLVYLPVSEWPTRLFYAFLERHGRPKNLHFLLPSREAFDLTSHKGSFQRYCELHQFPVPQSFKKTEILSPKFSFHPLIAKPFSGEGSVGIKHIDYPEQLSLLKSINSDDYLVQEKIQGVQKVAGAFFLCKNGTVLSQYTHQRLRTFPENGGVTVYSKSGSNKEILDIGAQLLRSLNWNGLAMIEFMQDNASKEWKIIELNPRLWGSVLLSAFNRSQMLQAYVQDSLEIEKPGQATVQPLENRYIRWWFPFELLSFLKGKLSWRELFKLDLKRTCYINFTYASAFGSIAYLLYFTFNSKSIKRFLKKLG